MSKVIQIVATPETSNEYAALYALRDDGSIYILVNQHGNSEDDTWEKLPKVPEESK